MKKRIFSIIFLMMLCLTIFNSNSKVEAAPPEDFDFTYTFNVLWVSASLLNDGPDYEYHLVTNVIDPEFYHTIPQVANHMTNVLLADAAGYNSVGAIYPGHIKAYEYWFFDVDLQELHFYDYKWTYRTSVPFADLVSVTTDNPESPDNSATVTYMANSLIYETQSVNKGSQVTLPENPTKENHVFVGWFTDPLFYYSFNTSTSVTQNFTLYAKFQPEDLSIKFYNGNNLLYVEEVVHGNKLVHLPIEPLLTSNVIDIYDGSFTNMIFNNNTKILTLSDGKELKVSEGAINVYEDSLSWNNRSNAEVIFLDAFSSIYKLNVYIKPNNNKNYSSEMAVYISKDKLDWTLLNTFVSGYTNDFNKQTFTNNAYKDGPYYLKLVNVPQSNSYSNLSINKLEITSRIDYEIPKQFEFENWYLDEELTIPYIKDEYVFTSDSNLYAKWVEKEYELSFNSNNGSPITSLFFKEDEEIVMPDNPYKIGYTFEAWYLDETLETEFNLETMPSNDVTLYAKWEETTVNQYLIEFFLEDDFFYTYKIYEEGTDFILPANPEAPEGQVFLGWYYDYEFTEKFKTTDLIEFDLLLYGKFGPASSGGGGTPGPTNNNFDFTEILMIVLAIGAAALVVYFVNKKKPKKRGR